MDDLKLADSYLKIAGVKSAKIDTDVLLILSALILIWIGMETMLPSVQKEVFQYNGRNFQVMNVSDQIASTLRLLDTVRAKRDTISSRQSKIALATRADRVREKVRALTEQRNQLKKKVSASHSEVSFKFPIVGEFKAPYYLSTVFWNALALIFVIYLFKTREELLYYYYNAIKIFQNSNTNPGLVNRDLGLAFSNWCLPLRRVDSHLQRETIEKSFGKTSLYHFSAFIYSGLLFLVLIIMACRSIYLSFWILNDLRFEWWYWPIFCLNTATLGTILWFGITWFLHKEVDFLGTTSQAPTTAKQT